MKSILFCLCLCFTLFAEIGGEYGNEIPLRRVPGVDNGAMAAVLYKDTLWIAGYRGDLYAFDVSNPGEPKLITKKRIMKSCRQMVIKDGIAAIVGRQHGMTLVDVRDPKSPQVLSRYQSIELATGIEVTGKYAYIGNRIYGVETVDISDPRKPRFLGNKLTREAQSVKAAGKLLLAGDWVTGQVQIFDASNPACLSPLNIIQLDGYGDGLDVQGNLVFAATGHHRKSGPKEDRHGNGHGVEIWDIENPKKPQRLSIFRFPRFFYVANDYWTVRVSGKYAFCADTHNGFYVLNVSDPKKPVCIGHAKLDEVTAKNFDTTKKEKEIRLTDAVSGLAVGKGVVYLTGQKTGLYVAELPGIAEPRKEESGSVTGEAKEAPVPELKGYSVWRPSGMVREAAVSGDIAFVAASEDGLYSVKLEKQGIKPLQHYPERFAFDVKIRGDFLYVAENSDGLGVYKIRENGVLERITGIRIPWNLDCQRIWAPEGTNLIIVSDHGGFLFFLDVSDPSKAKTVFRDNQVGIIYSDLMTHQLVGGRYLFFNWHHSGYAWYDVSGGKPVKANWKRFGFSDQVNSAASLGFRCLAIAGGGYYLLEPNQGGRRSDWKLIKVPEKILKGIPSVDADTLVISSRRTGEITVVDIKDLLSPVWDKNRSVTVPGIPGAVVFHKHRMVIPAGHSGLYLEHFPEAGVLKTEDQWKGWTLSPKSEQPEKNIRIEKNQLIAESHSKNEKRKYWELSAKHPFALQKGKNHILYAVIEAEKAGEILFDHKHYSPYKNLGLHSIKKLVPGENRIAIPFTPQECPAGKTPFVSIDLGRINGKVTVKKFEIVPEKILPLSLFPDTWKAEYNGTVKEVKAENGIIDLRKPFGAQKEGTEAVLTATFSSENYGILPIGISADWRMEVLANGNRCYSTLERGNAGPKNPKTHRAEIPVFRGENTIKIRVLSGSLGWTFIYGETDRTIYPEQSENWWRESVPIKNTVKKDSALDLSGNISAERNNTRIIYSPTAGGYAYEDDPANLIHFFSVEACPSLLFFARRFKSEKEMRKEIDLWAQSLKRRGFSSVRMNFLDNVLCHISKKDMETDPVALDRVMYAFSRLKREGLRLHLNILAYNLYANRKSSQNIFKDHAWHKIAFMFLNDFECERFRYGAEKMLNTVNPYTGKRLIDDPLLVSIEIFNEMDSCCDPMTIYGFYHWNKQEKFASTREKIKTAWQDFLKRKGLPLRPLPKVSNRENNLSEDASLFYEFHTEQLDRAFCWGAKILRDMGWRGTIINNSSSKRIGYGVSRWRSSNTVEIHGYFAHPSRRMQSGSKVIQRSSIGDLAEHFRSINSIRQYGRGFQVGEFGHVFWNRYIHEGGMVYPALAAFQGHQIICFFHNPYLPRFLHKGLDNFQIYSNPVRMANGFLGTVLFGRGDVKPARHQGVLNIPSSYWKKGNTAAFPINSEQSKIALMTGLSIAFPDEKPAEGTAYVRKPDFTLSPAKHGFINGDEWSSNIRDVNDGSFDLAAYTAELKKQGILPAENISDPAKGIFQTETGEIILNGPEKKMTIITPRTEAITWERKSQEQLGKLTVFPAKGHATIAVSSVDGKDLADSSRIVLIFSTEAINSEMKLSEDWTKLFAPGKTPILVRSGECRAELQAKPGSWKLYALGLDGERLEELPIENNNGKLIISFDTAKLKHGVTPFFELISLSTGSTAK